jgi:CO dehydrogenase/acetyl-CoA synthase beta subunit
MTNKKAPDELREIAEELLNLPKGKNKPLCWDMDILVKYISDKIATEQDKARIEELRALNEAHSITDKDMAHYIMGRKEELEGRLGK